MCQAKYLSEGFPEPDCAANEYDHQVTKRAAEASSQRVKINTK